MITARHFHDRKGDWSPTVRATWRSLRTTDFPAAMWVSSSSTGSTSTWEETPALKAAALAASKPVTNAFSWESPLAPCAPGPCCSQSPEMKTFLKLVWVDGMCWWDPGPKSVTAPLNRNTLLSITLAPLNPGSQRIRYWSITYKNHGNDEKGQLPIEKLTSSQILTIQAGEC